MASDLMLLALLWIAYCAVHSALISIPVTNWFKNMLADGYRFYRLYYNLFSLITLVPLAMYSHSARFNCAALVSWSGYFGIVRYSLAGLGVVLVLAGARHYSMLQFLGINQIRKAKAGGAMTVSGDLDSTGVLGLVRHPWYAAVFILLWTGNLNAASITVNIVLSAYLVVGTLLEECKLVIEFGEEYRRYQERVPMFFPLKWLAGSGRH